MKRMTRSLAKRTAAVVMSALIMVTGIPAVSFAAEEEVPEEQPVTQAEETQPGQDEAVLITGIIMNEETITVETGDQFEIAWSFAPENHTEAIDDSSVQKTISGDAGCIKEVGTGGNRYEAVTPGKADIIIEYNGMKAACTVTVKEKKIPLKTLSLSKKTLKINKGKTARLTVKYTPSDTTVSKTVTWTSSNKKVATVSSKGQVTAKKAGTATITAKMGGKKATCKVTVKAPLKKISLNYSKKKLEKGSTVKLKVKYTPSDTTSKKTVTWKSSNKKVATVSKSGKVTAKKPGTATITAKVGSKKATCRITVVKKDTHYKSASNAYKYLNEVRAMDRVGYLNPDNKTYTVFNTNSSNKLPKLKRDAALEKTARVRAKEISRLFSHTRPSGKDCFTAYPKNMTAYGENIFMASTGFGGDPAMLMMNSLAEADQPYEGQGHRRNILSPDFNVVGIACYRYKGVNYWVQCFGHK